MHPSALTNALSELLRVLPSAPVDRLRVLAGQLRECVPAGNDDLEAIADDVVATLASAGESTDREILVAQLEGSLGAIASLAADLPEPPAPLEAPPPLNLPAWVDAAMLAEFHDAQRSGLGEIEGILLEGVLGESERQRVARILHTLKGEAGTVGFSALEDLYHALEDHLEARGLKRVVDDVLAVKDWVLAAVPGLVGGAAEPPGRAALLAHLRSPAAEREPAPAPSGPEPTTRLPSDPEVVALFGEFHDESQESLLQADELLMSLEAGAADPATVDALFRIFHTIKGLAGFLDMGNIGAMAHAAETLLDQAREDLATLVQARVDLLLRTTVMVRRILTATRTAVETRSGVVEVDGYDDLLHNLVSARSGQAAARVAEPEERPQAEAPEGAEPSGASPTLLRETIKVDLSRVDNLVETIGELVIVEAMVTSSVTTTISQRTRHQLAQMSKIVRDLQRQGLALRMVPLRGVFQKMSRLVRDLSRRSSKPVNLELAGQDAEMDRSLAERLGDPLVHMIRNAVDHGVEPIAARRAAGKPDKATLRLSAFHEGGNIVIELSDDGKGLDRAAILAKAVSRGLVPAGVQLADRDVYELIFAPGFSTAEKVTELSGRGVGMDVVKRTVEELRGRIQISTELGRGTTFRLVLPLTLAIIDGMLLSVGGRRYVLPTLSIVESLRPRPGELHRFAGGPLVLDVRGAQLPLVDLGALLGVPSAASDDPASGFVVVVDDLRSSFGLLVDDLVGQQQVVIKTLDPSVNEGGLFSGAAILSDGHVGLILNPGALRSEDGRGRGTPLRLAEAG